MPRRPSNRQLQAALAPLTARARAAGAAQARPTTHCYGYARVSTAQQVSEGESLDVQKRTIAGYAQMHGLELERVFVERGVSGSRPLAERPAGSALIAALKPGDAVITPKLDRMFRSALDALDMLGKMKTASISLHMIDLGGDTTTNGVSKLVFTILGAVAEAERDRIRERISEVKRDQRQRGRFLGGKAPFGWRVQASELVPIPEQQQAIRRMQELRGQGHSLREIAARLNAEDGVNITHAGIAKILRAQEARQ